MEGREKVRQVWGVAFGGLLGFITGLILIMWGTLFRMETWRHIVQPWGNMATSLWYGITGQLVEHPWGVLTAMALLMAALGYLFTLTTACPRTCMVCGKPNPAKGKVCQYCGASLKEDMEGMVCPSCHEVYSGSSRFCPVCAVELIPKEAMLATRKSAVKMCPSCGATNLPQRTECHSCGHHFDQ